MIRHSSGRCLLPNDESTKPGTRIVLGTKNCRNQIYVFVWTAQRSLKHVITGMCLSLQGDNLVLQEGCDGGSNMKFYYIESRKQLLCSGRTVKAVQGGDNMAGMILVATETASNEAEETFTFESKWLKVNNIK